MNVARNASFQDELQKLGFSVPPSVLSAGIPAALGLALSGLAVYDHIKAKKLDPKITSEFITGTADDQVTSRATVKDLLKERPLLRPVVSVTTEPGVDKMLKDPRFGILTRLTLEPAAKNIVNKASNAAVIQGEDKDYVIIPRKAHPSVVEHEMGHLQDFARKIQDQPGLLRRLLSLVWKPEHDKQIMDRERRAWTYAKETPRKDQALKSYERSFHEGRKSLTVPAAAAMFLRGLANLPKGPV